MDIVVNVNVSESVNASSNFRGVEITYAGGCDSEVVLVGEPILFLSIEVVDFESLTKSRRSSLLLINESDKSQRLPIMKTLTFGIMIL